MSDASTGIAARLYRRVAVSPLKDDLNSKRYNLFIPVDEDRMVYQCEHEYCPARIHTHERSVILRGMTIRTRAVV